MVISLLGRRLCKIQTVLVVANVFHIFLVKTHMIGLKVLSVNVIRKCFKLLAWKT